MAALIGQPVPRAEDFRLITGRGSYADDVPSDDTLHCAFVRSSQAHAMVLSVDADAARAVPGVVAVFTLDDYRADGNGPYEHVPSPFDIHDVRKMAFVGADGSAIFSTPQWPLADGHVRYLGEPIALVVAESAATAAEAADAVVVDYSNLPCVQTTEEALAKDAPQLWPQAPGNRYFTQTIGDEAATAAAFATARHVFQARFTNNRVANCQMEPRAVVAAYSASGGLHVVSGTQGVTRLYHTLSKMLKTPAERVRVVSGDVGGGFGPLSQIHPEQILIPWVALRLGRPARWTSTRSEAFLTDFQGRDALADAEMAFDAAGRILAYRIDLASNVGAYTATYVPAANAIRLLTTVYHVPAAFGRVHGVASNTVPTAPYRGAGRPEAHHCIERLLDIAGVGLGIDRFALRRRNLICKAQMPYRTPMGVTYDSGDFVGNMDRVVAEAGWNGFAERQAAARKRGKLAGIAVVNHIETPNGAPHERLRVGIQADGTVELVAGTQSTGQGHETSFAQVAADLLGAPLANIRLRTGDTLVVANGGGTHSDRSIRLIATLLSEATGKLADQARPAAAVLLGVEAAELAFERGAFVHPASRRSLSLFDIAGAMEAGELPQHLAVPLTAQCDFHGRLPAYPCGSVVCELEIDRETGDVEITRYTSVDDVGQVINPLIVEGQIHGATVQGIGQALFEGVRYDGGQVVTGSFMDYGVARAADVPSFDVFHVEDPTSGNPLRVKGGGEGGIIAATPAVVGALCHALHEYGVRDLTMPVSPQQLWDIMNPLQPQAGDAGDLSPRGASAQTRDHTHEASL